MLRNVCDCCGSVIDGEPSMNKEYPEALLVIDDEIIVMYENICQSCRKDLIGAVESIMSGKHDTKKQTQGGNEQEQIRSADTTRERADEHPNAKQTATPVPTADNKPSGSDERALANQVVRQFPVKLPQRD